MLQYAQVITLLSHYFGVCTLIGRRRYERTDERTDGTPLAGRIVNEPAAVMNPCLRGLTRTRIHGAVIGLYQRAVALQLLYPLGRIARRPFRCCAHHDKSDTGHRRATRSPWLYLRTSHVVDVVRLPSDQTRCVAYTAI